MGFIIGFVFYIFSYVAYQVDPTNKEAIIFFFLMGVLLHLKYWLLFIGGLAIGFFASRR